MSISDKQLEANRANAQHSTGPRTEEGKNKSRLNGYRHGITGMATLMVDEDRQSRTEFVNPFIKDLDPVGMAEYHLANSVAIDHWRLNRIRAVEDNTFAWGHFGRPGNHESDHPEIDNAITMARTFMQEQKAFNTLSLYEQRITRNIHKNMKLLIQLQDRRRAEERLKAKSKPLTHAASASSHENGFGFSTTQTAQKQPAEAQKTPPIAA